MSGINSGAEIRNHCNPVLPGKSSVENAKPSMGILINAVGLQITKDGRVPLSSHQVSIMFDRLSDFLLPMLLLF
jgi:hypothetical protein